MKTMILTRGKVALVDDDDYILLSKYKWTLFRSKTSKDYAYRAQKYKGDNGEWKNKTILMHRVILEAQNGDMVDHVNGNTLDNRRDNLRFCSKEGNQRNRLPRQGNNFGFKGITFDKSRHKWRARIDVGGKAIVSKRCDSPEEAARYYDELATKHFGEFARCNFD